MVTSKFLKAAVAEIHCDFELLSATGVSFFLNLI